MAARYREIYKNQIRKELFEEGGFENMMCVPVFKKIVLNMGVGESTTSKTAIEESVEILQQISGQKPIVTKAHKAISAFKIREGWEVGVAVTLRGDKMWEFYDKLINVVFPRTKDFHGLSLKAFDGSGNYSIGIREHMVFPEIDPNKVQKIRSLQATIVTSARNDDEAKRLLTKLGFPFVKDVNTSAGK